MFPVFTLVGLYWLAASTWIHMNGDPTVVWVSLLPAVWLGTMSLFEA